VDLIHTAEGKYGNWDPSVPVRLGDYGYIDRKTGAFNAQGNIYEGNFVIRHADTMAALGEPTTYPRDNHRVISSDSMTQFHHSADANLTSPAGIADVSVNWKFKFGKRHGVALVMLNPAIRKFPKEGDLKPLLKVVNEELKGKVLVTSAITCDAYGFIIGHGSNEYASLGLAGGTTAALPVSGGAGAQFSWIYSSTVGVWKVGSPEGQTYHPIFELSVLKRGWEFWNDNKPVTYRDGVDGPVPSDSPFQAYAPPWGSLDEEGEEIDDEEEYI